MDSMSCLRGMFLLKSVCASEVELFIVSQHFAAAPFANGNCSEKTFSWRNIGFSVWPVPFHVSILTFNLRHLQEALALSVQVNILCL